MDYSARQHRLSLELHRARLPAFILTHLPNIRYLFGFTGSAGVAVVIARPRSLKMTFYTDGRYAQQAGEEIKGAKIVITRRPALLEAAEGLLYAKVDHVGFETDQLPHGQYRQLVRLLRGKVRLKATSGMIEKLREIKDSAEIEQIRAAVLMGSNLLDSALSAIRPGVTEAEVAGELELHARRAGAEKMSFDTIIAAGPRSALPHGRASAQVIPGNGFIILDYGVILAGYCSDMTRTVHVGRVSVAHRRMYEAVLESQLAGIDAVRPGSETGEVDRACREILKRAGYDAYFTHSTGHGVGLEIHEQPRLAKGQKQRLEPGMVITIEPGIYIPADGGVRIEDMVLVTESGHQVLTTASKELITL
ncbi:MAG: M24 family metallopeptidase [Candidatus Angelobacter sp.]